MNCQVHNRTIKKWKKWKEKHDSKVKTWKGSLEQKRENFRRLMGRVNRRMKGQRSDIRSLFEVLNPFQNQKIWIFYSRVPSPNFWAYHSRSWCLSNYRIQRQTKMNLFKMLDFQRIHFSKKGLKCATSLLNQFVKINLLSQIIWFQVNIPFGDF